MHTVVADFSTDCYADAATARGVSLPDLIRLAVDEYIDRHPLTVTVSRTGCNANGIMWERYTCPGSDVRDGLSPEKYVRKLRDEDRDEILF